MKVIVIVYLSVVIFMWLVYISEFEYVVKLFVGLNISVVELLC